MQMDSRIILAGQPVNALQALDAGTRAAGNAAQVGRTADLWNLYRDQGAGIMSGDQNALRALAGLDPMAALGVQEQQQGMRIREEQLQLARAAGARAAQQHVASLDAAQAARERAQIEQGLMQVAPMLQRQDLEGINQAFRTFGLPPVQTIEDAYGIFAQYEGAYEVYNRIGEMSAGPEPDYVTINDQLVNRNAEGGPAVVPVQGLQPGGPDTVVNVNSGAENPYVEGMGESAVNRHNIILEQAASANEFIGDLQLLSDLSTRVETGAGGEVMVQIGRLARRLGVDIEGLPEQEAILAIQSRLVPQMRPAGSGAASDFDGRQFLESLPNLSRTPEGNRIVNETLQALQRHRLAAGDIVLRASRGEISWQEADREIAALGNPYESFNRFNQSITAGQGARVAPVDRPRDYPEAAWNAIAPENRERAAELWRNMTPEQRRMVFE